MSERIEKICDNCHHTITSPNYFTSGSMQTSFRLEFPDTTLPYLNFDLRLTDEAGNSIPEGFDLCVQCFLTKLKERFSEIHANSY